MKQLVDSIVNVLEQGDFVSFMDNYVHDDVKWTITGTNKLARTYQSKSDFIEHALKRISATTKHGIKMDIKHVFTDSNTLIIEMVGISETKNGKAYNNEYCWIFELENNKIVVARVYYDDVLVNTTLEENEK